MYIGGGRPPPETPGRCTGPVLPARSCPENNTDTCWARGLFGGNGVYIIHIFRYYYRGIKIMIVVLVLVPRTILGSVITNDI